MTRYDPHREAWTAFVEGRKASRPGKYHNVRTGKYASKREAEVAQKLHILAEAGKIQNLREQVPFELIPGDGKLRPVRYVADFTYYDQHDFFHVIDVKGGEATKTRAYKLKFRLMKHVHNIDIEEV